MFTIWISNTDFGMEFYFFGIKKVWKSMEFDVFVGVWTLYNSLTPNETADLSIISCD